MSIAEMPRSLSAFDAEATNSCRQNLPCGPGNKSANFAFK